DQRNVSWRAWGYFRVEDDRDPAYAGRRLFEQPQVLTRDRRFGTAEAGAVALGLCNILHQANGYGITAPCEHDWNGLRLLLHRPRHNRSTCDDHVGCERYQLHRIGADMVGIISGEAKVDPQVAAFNPAELYERLLKGSPASLRYGIAFGPAKEPADPPHALALLRQRRHRPRHCRAAKQRDELAAPRHSITSSARASTVAGRSSPSAFAVLRLITSSYLVGA